MLVTVFALSVLLGNLDRPHLTIAQGIEESKLNPRAVGSIGEKGAWQVREEYWGKVPKRLGDQARHAEGILADIKDTYECSWFEALRRYNGSGHKARKYAQRVRQRAFELALVTMPETSIFDIQGVENATLRRFTNS